MQYMVTGLDGKEYGPTDLATLKTWVAENRLAPTTVLRDFNTGQTMAASAVPGLFAQPDPNVPPRAAAYARPGTTYAPAATSSSEGGGTFAWIVVRSILGALLFFVLHGIGLLVAGSSLYSAFQLHGRGSKWGIPALAISGLAVVAVGVGWAIRLSTGQR